PSPTDGIATRSRRDDPGSKAHRNQESSQGARPASPMQNGCRSSATKSDGMRVAIGRKITAATFQTDHYWPGLTTTAGLPESRASSRLDLGVSIWSSQ